MKKTIGCVLLTCNAKEHLPHGLPPLLNSPLKPRLLIVDSSSDDGTIELAKQFGVEAIVIPKEEFNHGATREMARHHLGTDIIVMITQDAYLANEHTLEALVTPILHEKAAAAYARQIPHRNASFFESFPREFNYPEKSQLRSLRDLPKYGVYTFFCSNSCAAYDSAKLDEIGGFPSVILGEDTVAVAMLLRKGYYVAYVAEALVHHSHCYSLKQEFKRSYQTGMARQSYAHLLQGGGSDSKRGVEYAKAMLKRLAMTSPQLIPYACFHLFTRWLGYQLGARKKIERR